MKKYLNFYFFILPIFIISAPVAIIHAQTLIDATAAGSIGASIDAAQAPVVPRSTLEKIKSDLEARNKNLQVNQETRKTQIEDRRGISTTSRTTLEERGRNIIEQRRGIASTSREIIKDVQSEDRRDLKAASTSVERKEIKKEMYRDIFNIERQKIAMQLELSIQNLKQIRNRIDSRIQKEQQTGRDMSSAIKLLVIADTKIMAATDVLKTFKDFKPVSVTASSAALVSSTSTNNSSSTQIVNLDAARKMTDTVKSTIKDAQRSLNEVIIAIAHAMGLKLGNQPTTSPLTTASTSPAASTTPSATPTTTTQQ